MLVFCNLALFEICRASSKIASYSRNRGFEMKKYILISFFAILAFAANTLAAPKKVIVRGVPDDVEMIGKSKCIAPYLCKKKDQPGLYEYNSGVWGNPKFSPGEVILRDGSLIVGEVAVLQTKRDWGFVKNIALIIPEGEDEAWYFGSGDAQLISQKKKKETDVFDMYGSVYLERLVSGKLRLSYNPAAGTSKKIADFLPATLLESAERQARGRAALAALKDGKSVKQAMKDGEDFSGAVTKVVASIEITEKEYLLFDEADSVTILITKANYEDVLQGLFSKCSNAEPKKIKSFKSYKKIEKAIIYLNTTCSN